MNPFKPKTVKDYLKKARLNAQKQVKVFNPDLEPFSVTYDGEKFLIDSLEIAEYQHHIANHIAKHLANKLLNKRGIKDGSNPQKDLKDIKKEIFV